MTATLLLLGCLLLHARQAARARCTVGEISDALERAWGRHTASAGVAPGYYVTEREAAATGGRVGKKSSLGGGWHMAHLGRPPPPRLRPRTRGPTRGRTGKGP